MARLEWKEVEAPDFKGASGGYLAASRLFGEAIESAKSGLQDFQKTQSDQADNAVLEGLMAYQGKDPAELEKAMQDGSFMNQFDPSVKKNLSAGTRQTLLTRPAALLEHAVNTSAYKQQQLVVADKQLIRDNMPLFNEFTSAIIDGKKDVADKLRADNPNVFGKVNTALLDGMITDAQARRQGFTSGDQSYFNLNEDRLNLRNSEEDRALGIQVEGLRSALNTEFQPSAHLRQLNQNRAAYEEKFGARAVSQLINSLSGANASAGGGGAGGASAGAGGGISGTGTGVGGKSLYSVVLGDTGNGNAYGINPPKPVEQMNLGELYDFQRNEMLPKTIAAGIGKNAQGKVIGSSAVGAYQIVSTTLADHAQKLWGNDWKSKTFSAENQDMLGESIFNAAKDKTQLHKVWEGLPKADYTGKSWAEMRDIITKHESGGVANPAEAKAFQDATIQQQYATEPLTPLEVGFKENWQNTSSSKQMALGMIAKGGDFEGENANYLGAVIQDVANKYKLSPALAAVAVRQSVDGEDGIIRSLGSRTFGDGLTVYIDDDRLDKNAKMLQNRPALAAKVAGTVTRGSAMANTGAAQDELKAANAALKAARADAAARGNTKPDLSLELTRVAAAEEMVKATLAKGKETMTAGEPDGEDPTAPGPKPKAKPKGRNPSAPMILASAVNAPAPARGPLMAGPSKPGGGGDIARVQMALNSGLPQFSKKSGESDGAWKSRVTKMVLGR